MVTMIADAQVRMQLAGACTTPLTTHVRSSGPAPTLVRTAAALVQKEGMTALYRGLSASLLRQATFIGTKFGSYDILKGYCQQCSTSNAQYANASAVSNAAAGGAGISFVAKTVCGFGAGALGAAVGNPADLAMVRMQADGRLPLEHRRNYRHVGDALVRIIRQEGVGTLWRGCSPTVQRAMIITASQLAVYDQVKVRALAQKWDPTVFFCLERVKVPGRVGSQPFITICVRGSVNCMQFIVT